MHKFTFYAKLLFTTISWGGSFVAVKYLLDWLSPDFLVFVRFLATLVFLVAILFLNRKVNRADLRIAKPDLIRILLLGTIGIGLVQYCLNFGVKYTNASTGSLIMSMSTIITVLVSRLIGGEKFSTKKILGVVFGFLGIIMILNPQAILTSLGDGGIWGKFLLLISATGWALYSVLGKLLLKKYDPLVVTCYAMCGGVISLLPFSMNASQWIALVNMGFYPWLVFIFSSLVAGSLGYMFWYSAIRETEPGRVIIFMNVVPLSGGLLAIIFLGESLSFLFLVGMAMIVIGITLVARSKQRIIR